MSAYPDLYVKWWAFRELFQLPKSNREIAISYWGPNEGPPRFSKMLRGDYGCSPDAAAMLADIINKRIETWRAAHGAKQAPDEPAINGNDLALGTNEFVRRMLAVAGPVDRETLERTNRMLVSTFAGPHPDKNVSARLKIERYSTERVFEGFVGAEPDRPVEFDPDRHLGQMVLELPDTAAELQVYAMLTRDPSDAGQWFWEASFGKAVFWLPSPFVPVRAEDRLTLLPEPRPVLPLAGRFHATAVVVRDREAVSRLDPRPPGAGKSEPLQPASFDGAETARFLTNLGRVAARQPDALWIASAAYSVKIDGS